YDFVGTKTFGSIGGYEDYAKQFIYPIDIPGCAKQGRVFVGQRNEPFVVNLGPVFDLINFVPIEGDSAPGAGDGKGFPGGITQSADNDIISDKNITTLALEVHKSCLVGSGNGVIGVWTSASLPQVRVLNPRPKFEIPDVAAVPDRRAVPGCGKQGRGAGHRQPRAQQFPARRPEGRFPRGLEVA